MRREQRERSLDVMRRYHARMLESRSEMLRELREVFDDSQRERFDRFARPNP